MNGYATITIDGVVVEYRILTRAGHTDYFVPE